MPGREGLALGRVQELQVGLGRRAGALAVGHLVDDGDRRLGEDAERRDDDVDLVRAQLPDREEGLVLPGEEDVAEPPLDEGVRRAAGPRVEDRDVPEERGDEVAGLRLASPGLLERPRPRGEVVPARAARGLRVRGDDRDSRLHEVAPVPNALRVPLADEEDDRRGVRRGVVRQALLPVLREEARVGDRVDVVGEGEGDDVGLEPVDDRAGLLARAAVRLLDGHGLSGLRLPLRGEGGVHLLVELARRVVGDVEELLRGRAGGEDEEGDSGEYGLRSHGLSLQAQKDSWVRTRRAFSAGRSAPCAAPPSKVVRS